MQALRRQAEAGASAGVGRRYRLCYDGRYSVRKLRRSQRDILPSFNATNGISATAGALGMGGGRVIHEWQILSC